MSAAHGGRTYKVIGSPDEPPCPTGTGLGVVGWTCSDPEAELGQETPHICLFRIPMPREDPQQQLSGGLLWAAAAFPNPLSLEDITKGRLTSMSREQNQTC